MRNVIIVTLCLSISSCATIVNRRSMKIEVHSKDPAVRIALDSWEQDIPSTISVPRSRDNLKLVLRKDSTEKIVEVKSRLSPEFKWGNLVYLYGAPVAYLFDLTATHNSKEKLYGYTKKILVDFENSKVSRYVPNQKGLFNLVLSAPVVNYQNYKLDVDRFEKERYKGISASIEYYHSPRAYLSFTAGYFGLDDEVNPIPGETFDPQTKEISSPLTLIAQHNNVIRALSLGYGLSLTRYSYTQIVEDVRVRRMAYWSLGVGVSADVRIIQGFHVGVRYSPTFYNLAGSTFEYADIASLELKYKIALRRPFAERK